MATSVTGGLRAPTWALAVLDYGRQRRREGAPGKFRALPGCGARQGLSYLAVQAVGPCHFLSTLLAGWARRAVCVEHTQRPALIAGGTVALGWRSWTSGYWLWA